MKEHEKAIWLFWEQILGVESGRNGRIRRGISWEEGVRWEGEKMGG